MVLSSIRIGYLQLPPVSLVLLLVVVALSRVGKRLSARWGLSSSDLLIIYCMMLVGAMVSSHGVAEKLVPLLVIPKEFANSSNNWHGFFDLATPHGLVPWNPSDAGAQSVIQDYYNKMPRGASVPWGLWLRPLCAWGVLVALVLFAYLCLAAILRRQWVDNEKLSFPLAQLPLEIAGSGVPGGGHFFSNRAMWLGALVPIVVFGIKGLHKAVPSVPDIVLQISINDYLLTPPWNGIPYTGVVLSFAAVGFFFLLPVDILFSIWFFFLLSRLMQVGAVAYNLDTPGLPQFSTPLFIGYQVVGAYFTLVGYFFWIARPHLRRVWAAAWGRERGDDADELLSYPVAVWGLLGSILLAAAWLWVAGMSLWLAVSVLVISILVISLVMTRTVAEAGMLMTETTFSPMHVLRLFTPLHALGPANLTMLAYFDSLFCHDQRALLLAGFMDSARIADGAAVRRRSFVGAFAVGIVLALVIAVGLNVSLPYHLGANNMDGWLESGSSRYVFTDYARYFQPGAAGATGADWQMPVFFAVGSAVTLCLTVLRAAFFWWPLHPLGYALMGTWTTTTFWFPCLLAWLCKALALRYGGMGFYTKARPFFLGLVLGEFGMAVFFVLLSLLFHLPVPDFPWP